MNKNINKIIEVLNDNGLPYSIMDYLGIDTDGSIVYDLESIEALLGETGTSYGECMIYEELAMLKGC